MVSFIHLECAPFGMSCKYIKRILSRNGARSRAFLPPHAKNHAGLRASLNNIGAIIMPADALGGIPALAAEYNDIPLIAVTENQTVLNMTNEKMKMRNVIEVSSYLEAAGVVVALREGISIESLRRPIESSRLVDLPVKSKPLSEKVY